MQTKHNQPHSHSHSVFSRKHLQDHPLCLASLIYNILVIAVEILILAVVTDMSFHDLIGYEGALQAIHLLGVIFLSIVNYYWIHTWAKTTDTKTKATAKLFSISTILFFVHIILLHLVPRWIGFELHHHEHGALHDAHAHAEQIEYIALAGVIIFISFAFWYKESVLHFFGVKNKYLFSPFAKKR